MNKLITFIATFLCLGALIACAPMYQVKGFTSEEQYNLAVAKNLTPYHAKLLNDYNIVTSQQYDAAIVEMNSSGYSSNNSLDELVAYLGDKTSGNAEGISAVAFQKKRLAKIAKDAEEKSAQAKAMLKKATYKTCEQFTLAFSKKYEYAYDWPNISCEFTSDNNAALVIKGYNPARNAPHSHAQWFYQPSSETVLYRAGSGRTSVLRANNFIDASLATDMNATGDIFLKNLPPNQQAQVCSRIKSVSNYVVDQHDFRIAAGYQVSEIAKQGNWDFKVIKSGSTCSLRINVDGSFQGTSYKKSLVCNVGQIVKQGDGFTVKYLEVQGCK